MKTGAHLKHHVEETERQAKQLASAVNDKATFLAAGTILFFFDEIECGVETAKSCSTEFQTWIGNTRTRYRYQEKPKHSSPKIFLTVDDTEKLMKNLPSVHLTYTDREHQ